MTQTLTLRDLADEALALDELISMDHGEWTDEHEQLANELTEKLLRKTDSFANYITDLAVRCEVIRAEEKRLAERRRRLEADLDRLSNYAMTAMHRMATSKLVGTTHTISVKLNPPSVKVDEKVVLADPELRNEFASSEVVWKIDKAAIKRCIQSGTPVPGCELTQGTRLEVK